MDGIIFNEYEFEQAVGVGDDREACRAVVHGFPEYWILLSDLNEQN